jgi:hypothetical protein
MIVSQYADYCEGSMLMIVRQYADDCEAVC